MGLAFVTLWLIGLLFLFLIIKNIRLLNPGFCFSIGFLVSSGYAIITNSYIQLNMGFETVIVIVLGTFMFVIASVIFRGLGKKQIKIGENTHFFGSDRDWEMYISNFYLIIFGILQLIAIIFIPKALMRITGKSNISDAIFRYRVIITTGIAHDDIPRLLSIIWQIAVPAGYIWTYSIADAISKKKKINIFLIVNAVLCCILNTVYGARGTMINYIISFLAMVYFLSSRNKKQSSLNKKFIIGAITLAIIILSSFHYIGSLIGRGNTQNIADYLTVYISAPLKNLDSFVKRGEIEFGISKNYTLYALINWIGSKFGIDSIVHTALGEWQSVGGKNLGNVYTTLASFYHDGGLIGVCFYSLLMALITMAFYNRTNRDIEKFKNRYSINLIIYSFFVPNLFFCFFSNRFYENVFINTFVRYILLWWVLINFLFKDNKHVRRSRFKRNR